MSCQLHLGEVPLPDGLEETVIADVRVFLGRGERIAASWQAVATRRLCRGSWGFDKSIHRRVLLGKGTRDQQNLSLFLTWKPKLQAEPSSCNNAVEICVFVRAEIFAVQTHMNPLTLFLEGDPIWHVYVMTACKSTLTCTQTQRGAVPEINRYLPVWSSESLKTTSFWEDFQKYSSTNRCDVVY